MADLLPIHGIYNGALITDYIRTSDVYGETGDMQAKVGIKRIKDADLSGNEVIVPVKEVLRTGAVSRITIRYKITGGKRKSAKILVNKLKMPGVFGEVAANTLENVQYKVGTLTKGTITSVGIARRATSY